jgi:hypothetical protein
VGEAAPAHVGRGRDRVQVLQRPSHRRVVRVMTGWEHSIAKSRNRAELEANWAKARARESLDTIPPLP